MKTPQQIAAALQALPTERPTGIIEGHTSTLAVIVVVILIAVVIYIAIAKKEN